MDPMREMIKRHEGLRLFPYVCPAGKLTIGYGRNLEEVGISKGEAEALLMNDIWRAEREIEKLFPGAKLRFNEARYAALVDMMFNLGAARFRGFRKMIQAVRAENWDLAAKELLDSRYARQVKGRAVELSRLLKTGEFEDPPPSDHRRHEDRSHLRVRGDRK